MKTRPCKTCHGSGQVPARGWWSGGTKACPNCGGSGERFPAVTGRPR